MYSHDRAMASETGCSLSTRVSKIPDWTLLIALLTFHPNLLLTHPSFNQVVGTSRETRSNFAKPDHTGPR